ncbi:ABC transporter substrate-binding protein [Neisseria arctica]|uniref:ABC transporter substrate-binding protein n=1 Tax=Neisseria arctica TaxID=1470200 RepID=A0A0J0YU60_9NEIS|nr:basic amino acid ABC transporter substrate-binding protein [Neisseria arctica]KLT73635.1 ABC transporter substrate-binding protein [Neisseria arctica]UOO85761.1 basic amino acid ABC transporter substrate-binding protein [Neisseria arctica]
MFKKTAVLAALASALFLGACSKNESSQKTATEAPAGKTYIVAADAAYAPFEFEDNGKVVGFSIDILDAIAAKEGIKFDYVNTPWEGIFANLNKGDSDVVSSSVTITDERKASLDFSDPYFEASQLIVVGEKGDTIKSFADLKKHTVSVQNGTTGDLVVQKLQGANSTNIKRFENMPLALTELLSGGADASVGDNGVVQNFVNNNPNAKLRTITDPSFEKEYYGFVVKKGRSDELLSKINSGLAAIKADGTYQQIQDKWFGGAKQAAASEASAAK